MEGNKTKRAKTIWRRSKVKQINLISRYDRFNNNQACTILWGEKQRPKEQNKIRTVPTDYS